MQMMINFGGTSPPLTDFDLNEVERRFGFIFPSAFRRHYLKQNGGHPDKRYFVDENGTRILHDFLPIKASAIATLGTLETNVQRLKVERHLIPPHLVPFANDPFGNFYCFSVGEQDYGAIYWLKMEGKRKPGGDFLSPSLDDFLAALKTEEETTK
jgi:SMI1-KNR4 cell-wall